MLNPWFSSASGRRSQPRQRLPSSPSAPEGDPSDVASVSQSTVGPIRTPGNLTSASDARLDEVHARTPSLIHSTERDGGTLRTSDVPTSLLDPTAYNAPITKQTRASEEALFTPQDAIIAQVFGKPVPSTADPAHTPPPSAAPPSASLQTTSDSLLPPSSTQTTPSTRVRLGTTLSIYDPFSGAKLGERAPVSALTVTPGGLTLPVPPPTSDDSKLWSSLERILGLQAEIAVMHTEMESVGGKGLGNIHFSGMTGVVGAGEGGNVGPGKRSRRGQTLPIGDEEPEEHEPEGVVTGGAISEISVTDHSDGGDEDEDDEDDIHGHGKRRRDEEFARLAEQFAQRKVAIGKIMNKLDDLSTALKTFHTLPAPLFDLATPHARTDTMSSAPSNASATSSSLLPPTSSRRVTTQPGSRTPPIPPISTLAPPTSLGDSSGQPSLLVTPVLPRTALPTIIPGAPHVESPADMNAPRPAFHEVPRGR